MKTLYVLEKADVRKTTGNINVKAAELLEEIYEAWDALNDFANDSIYADTSEGCCYEDNISFLRSEKRHLIETLKSLKDDIDNHIENLADIEPNLD